jgi:hypothetical protein
MVLLFYEKSIMQYNTRIMRISMRKRVIIFGDKNKAIRR